LAVSVTLRYQISDLTDLLVRNWDFLARIGVVAQPSEASCELDVPSRYCVAPLRLGGLRGKKITPSDWLGGTGVVSTVDKWEWHGAQDFIRGGR
jgi:hypothetical protein